MLPVDTVAILRSGLTGCSLCRKFEYNSAIWAYYILSSCDWGAFMLICLQKCSPFFIDHLGALWYDYCKNCSPKGGETMAVQYRQIQELLRNRAA